MGAGFPLEEFIFNWKWEGMEKCKEQEVGKRIQRFDDGKPP